MAAVFVTDTAAKDLTDLITEHALPVDTPIRVRKVLRHLTRFPLMGSPLEGRWERSRFLLGPWRWMLIVYEYVAEQDAVFVTTIQDSRRATSATADRRN